MEMPYLPPPNPSPDGADFLHDFEEVVVSLTFSFVICRIKGSNRLAC